MKKHILITGGAGFIGYHLALNLANDKNNYLVLVDNLQRGKIDGDLEKLLKNERVKFIEQDVSDSRFYENLKEDFDHVYHLAAINGTKYFYEMPHIVLRTNILSLIYLLEWIAKQKKKPKLCFTSSCDAYAGALEAFGKLPLPTPEEVPLVVSEPHNPRWSYGCSKIAGELLVINYAKQFKFPAIIVRPHNFYGPRDQTGHVIPDFYLRILSKQDRFNIYGADDTRDFCYIDDAVEAMQKLMDSEATNNFGAEIINIGGNSEIKIKRLAELMFKIAGWKPKKVEIKESPKGSVKRRKPDITKIKRVIGWTPTTSLEEGLLKTYAWYKEHYKEFI